MPISRASTYVAAGVLLLTGVLLCAYAARQALVSDEYFSKTLTENGVREEVRFGKRQLTVDGVRVTSEGVDVDGRLRLLAISLAFEKSLARRQPLFALPGVDLALMRSQLESVASVQGRIASKQGNSRDVHLAKTNLYPIRMLEKMIAAEEARRAFLASGAKSDARAYRRALDRAIREYIISARSFRTTFEESVPPDARPYAVPSVILERSSVIDTALSFERTGYEAHVRLQKRLACTRGSMRACGSDSVALPHFDTSPLPSPSPSLAQASMSDDIMRAAKLAPFELDDVLADRRILLRESSCMANDPAGAPLFAVREIFPDLPGSWLTPMYVGNVLLLHAAKGSTFSGLPYLKIFVDGGVEFALAHPLIYYECPSSAADMGAVMSVREVFLFATVHTPSAHVDDEHGEELARLERRLGESAIIHEADAVAYLNELMRFVRHGILPSRLADAAIETALLYAYRSSGVLYVLHDVATAETSNMRQAEERGVEMDFSLRNVIYTRNALPALFLADNVSVAPGYQQLFKRNDLPARSQPYVYYSSLMHEDTGWTSLVRSMRFYHVSFEL